MKRTIGGGYGREPQVVEVPVGKYVVMSVVGLMIFVLLAIGGAAGCKEYNRYQKRADRANQTRLVQQDIKTMNQRARVIHAQEEVTRAKAEQRAIEADGIKRAQDIIQATLTDKYLIHEAIASQKAIATSGKNNTVIYVPSDRMGTPIMTQDASAGSLTRSPQVGK